MHILYVVGQNRDSKAFNDYVAPMIKQMQALHSSTHKVRVGLLFPSNRTAVEIDNNGLILFHLNCIISNETSIPKLTPNNINDINGFINEFKPDIIHSFDQGFIGLITQSRAVSKKIVYLLSVTKELNETERVGITSKVVLGIAKQIGITSELINNFYNNCTAIIASSQSLDFLTEEHAYQGFKINTKDLDSTNRIYDLYRRMQIRFKDYEKKRWLQGLVNIFPSKKIKNKILPKLPQRRINKNFKKTVPTSIVYTGVAIIGSLLAFGIISGFSKIKSKKPIK